MHLEDPISSKQQDQRRKNQKSSIDNGTPLKERSDSVDIHGLFPFCVLHPTAIFMRSRTHAGSRIAGENLLASHVCFVLRPTRFAAISCLVSADAKTSAPHSRAHAMWMASMALTELASRT